MAKLFFALWPDEAAASALEALAGRIAARSGGKRVARGKIHLTLAFLGEMSVEREAAIRGVAARVSGAPIDARFDQAGCFWRARVAWAGTSEPAPALIDLQKRLAAELGKAGAVLEDRPFAPHVTLARRIERPIPVEALAPIAWRSRDFALVRSERDTGRYATLERWALR